MGGEYERDQESGDLLAIQRRKARIQKETREGERTGKRTLVTVEYYFNEGIVKADVTCDGKEIESRLYDEGAGHYELVWDLAESSQPSYLSVNLLVMT